MWEQLIQQLKNINYSVLHIDNLIQNYSENPQVLLYHINQIDASLKELSTNFTAYQSKITNQPWFQFIIGSLVTLTATFIFEYFKDRRSKKEYLYYLERMTVDQINMVIEIKDTILKFIQRIDVVIKNIEDNLPDVYSIDSLFFPLFSIRHLPEEINMKTSGSGYIDNKVGKIYAMSKDLPHIMNDVRLQLTDTVNRNEKIAFAKLNSPKIQKEQYKKNIKEFQQMVKIDILEKNIPSYLKKLAETLVAVREKSKTNSIIWRLRFTPSYRFYLTKNAYFKAKSGIMDNMDEYFKSETEKQLKIIRDLEVS